jgi:hypothetical protein
MNHVGQRAIGADASRTHRPRFPWDNIATTFNVKQTMSATSSSVTLTLSNTTLSLIDHIVHGMAKPIVERINAAITRGANFGVGICVIFNKCSELELAPRSKHPSQLAESLVRLPDMS